MDTVAELERLADRFKNRFHNDGLVQMVRDSFDMLVIDLYSVRQSLVMPDGLLDRLRQDPACLRRRQPGEFNPGPITVLGVSEAERERLMPELRERSRKRIADEINSARDRLVGADDAVSESKLTELIGRILHDTKPLDRDRNRVRAHRYERRGGDTTHLFIKLPDLSDQIGTLERYLGTLYLALTGNSFMMSMSFTYATRTTPQDLADVIVHGSINRATMAYGMVPQRPTDADPRPWYWAKREDAISGRGGSAAAAVETENDSKEVPSQPSG